MLWSKLKVTNDKNVKIYLLQYDASQTFINMLIESNPTIFTQTLLRPIMRCEIIHTSIVIKSTIDAVEVHFGTSGIVYNKPEQSGFGQPEQTFGFDKNLDFHEIAQLLYRMKNYDFAEEKYDFLDHNCNEFTKQFLQNTVESGLPPHILNSTDKGIQTAAEILSKMTSQLHPLAKFTLGIGPVLMCLGMEKPPLWSRILSRISLHQNSIELPSTRNKVNAVEMKPFNGRPVQNAFVNFNSEEASSDLDESAADHSYLYQNNWTSSYRNRASPEKVVCEGSKTSSKPNQYRVDQQRSHHHDNDSSDEEPQIGCFLYTHETLGPFRIARYENNNGYFLEDVLMLGNGLVYHILADMMKKERQTHLLQKLKFNAPGLSMSDLLEEITRINLPEHVILSIGDVDTQCDGLSRRECRRLVLKIINKIYSQGATHIIVLPPIRYDREASSRKLLHEVLLHYNKPKNTNYYYMDKEVDQEVATAVEQGLSPMIRTEDGWKYLAMIHESILSKLKKKTRDIQKSKSGDR